MTSSSNEPSEAPVVEVGEEDILIEESWLDQEWAELLEPKAQAQSSSGEIAHATPTLALSRSTAHASLACTIELQGLIMAVTLEGGAARLLVDRSEHDRAGGISALADLWRSCSDIALVAGAPVEELVCRNASTIAACRRVAGTAVVLCVLVDGAQTNNAIVCMNLKTLCG